MTAFSELLREHLKKEFLTVDGVATRWQLKPETIQGLLTGRLEPNGPRHVSFFAKEFDLPEQAIVDAMIGKPASPAPEDHFQSIFRMLKERNQ